MTAAENPSAVESFNGMHSCYAPRHESSFCIGSNVNISLTGIGRSILCGLEWRCPGLYGGLVPLGALILVGVLEAPQIKNAELWVIDDHQIIRYLGADGDLPLTEIPTTLLHGTEVGQYASALRFRPGYYLLKLLETSLWGDSVWLWYATRGLAFAAFLAAIAYVAIRLLGIAVGISFFAFCLT